jgi:hypothetical protein
VTTLTPLDCLVGVVITMATQPGIMGIVTTIVGLFSGEIFLGFIFGVALAGIALLEII